MRIPLVALAVFACAAHAQTGQPWDPGRGDSPKPALESAGYDEIASWLSERDRAALSDTPSTGCVRAILPDARWLTDEEWVVLIDRCADEISSGSVESATAAARFAGVTIHQRLGIDGERLGAERDELGLAIGRRLDRGDATAELLQVAYWMGDSVDPRAQCRAAVNQLDEPSSDAHRTAFLVLLTHVHWDGSTPFWPVDAEERLLALAEDPVSRDGLSARNLLMRTPACCALVTNLAIAMMRDPDPVVARNGLLTIRQAGPCARAAVPMLVELLASPDPEEVSMQALVLAKVDADGESASAIAQRLAEEIEGPNPNADTESMLVTALQMMGRAGEPAIPTLLRLAVQYPDRTDMLNETVEEIRTDALPRIRGEQLRELGETQAALVERWGRAPGR